MSECKKCGKELVCAVPFIHGKIHGHKSAPHGCPGEFDHYQWHMTKEETDAWFAAADVQEEE